jgi:hypothetical protein
MIDVRKLTTDLGKYANRHDTPKEATKLIGQAMQVMWAYQEHLERVGEEPAMQVKPQGAPILPYGDGI